MHLFWGQGTGFDFLAVVFYPVKEATIFDLFLVGKMVVLVDVSLELTVIPIPNFVASGEHNSKGFSSEIFRRYEMPDQVRHDERGISSRNDSGRQEGDEISEQVLGRPGMTGC